MYTKEDIFKVLTDYPQLWGGGGIRGQRTIDIEFRESRKKLYESVERINEICAWIETNTEKTKYPTRHISYGWKHFAEKDIEYIMNGEFILAALLCGYTTGASKMSFNPKFNMKATKEKRKMYKLEHGWKCGF